MPKLHASASWPFFNCPASKKESEKAAGSTCKPAREGSYIHALIAKHFRGEQITWPRSMDKKQRDMKWLFDSALYIYDELSEWFYGESLIECRLDGDPEITGTMDYGLYRYNPHPDSADRTKYLFIIDWKSGYIRDIENALCQLKTYSGLWVQTLRESQSVLPDKIYLYAGWLRDREYESDPGHPFTVEEIDAHMAVLRANLQNQDVYVTGEHCATCGGRSGCKANASRVTSLIKRDPTKPVKLTSELAVWTQEVLPSARRAVKDAEESLRNYVTGIEDQGGKVVHDGKRLTIGPGSEAKRYVLMNDYDFRDIVIASPHINLKEIDKVAQVPFGALKEAVMNNAEHGKKGKTVREFEALLDAKGLIVKSKRRGSLKLEKENSNDATK